MCKCEEVQYLLQMSQHPVLQKYVEKISKNVFQRPVPFAAASMSQEWRQRADSASGSSRYCVWKKENEKSMPLDVMTGASVPKSSPRTAFESH